MHAPTATESVVFVVNSEPAFLDVMDELLSAAGCRVQTSLIASWPLDAIIAARPDLLILDFPHQNDLAWALLDAVSAHPVTMRTPLIATSTDANNLHRVPDHAGDQRMATVMLKPLDLELVLAMALAMLHGTRD